MLNHFPMRILHVINRLAEVDGGPPRGLVTLAKAQAALGDDITILPCSSLAGKPLIGSGQYGLLNVLEAPTDSSLKFPNKALKNTLLDLVKNFDIVHIHGSWRYHLVSASSAARRYGIPYIVRPAGNLGRIPRSRKAYIKWPYFWLVDKPIMKRAAAIHCCTVKESDELQQLNIGADIFILPNPVEDSFIDLEDKQEMVQQICQGLQPDDIVVLYLGRIASIKQLPVLLEAFSRVSKEFENIKLILAGPLEDLKLSNFLQKQVEKEHLTGKVYMPGMVQGELKAALFRRGTVFVQPSAHENFGMSVAEALLFGKPCIVSDGVALADEVASATAGIKYSGGVDGLTAALYKVISDGAFRSSCEQAAKKLCMKFKPDKIVIELKKVYCRFIES